MNKCRTTRKNQHCGVEVVQEPSRTPCSPINVCLGFGRSLVWSGNCPEVRGTPTIEDGWYSQVHVVDGCIVDARDAQIPVYTPAPCAPAASPCEDGGSSSVTLNPAACNLLTFTSGMLDARLHFGDSTGVTVTGCGTANDPLRFSVEVDAGSVFVKSGSPLAIGVEGDGSAANPFTISLANSPLDAGWHGAYEIDMYGRVIGFDATRTGLIEGVNDGEGIELKVEAGILTANLKNVAGEVAGQYTTGGYTYTVNAKGQVTNIRRDITITEDTYQLGSYNVTVNAYGSITRIEPVNVDNSAIPDTFIGTFRGQAGSADTEREMTFTTELDGPLHVEYRGMLGSTTTDPGLSVNIPSGFIIQVDGVALTDTVIEVSGVLNATGATNAIVGIRATSQNAIAAGQHTVTILAPTAFITQRDGVLRAQIVGRGA